MKTFLLLTALVFGLSSHAENFLCGVDSYLQKVADPSTQIQDEYNSVMKSAVTKWFEKVGGRLGHFNSFSVNLTADSGSYKGQAADLSFSAEAVSANGVKYSFKLDQHIFVEHANHPLDNSIQTCGPFSGLPLVFDLITVYDENGNKADTQLADDVFGYAYDYQYKLDI